MTSGQTATKWRHGRLRTTGLVGAAACVALASVGLISSSDVGNPLEPSAWTWPASAFGRSSGSQGLCDPFSKPGYVHFDPERPLESAWIPHDATCPPAPDYLRALRLIRDAPIASPLQPEGADQWGRPLPSLDFLKGRLALAMGDSVDRSVVHFVGALANAPLRYFWYDNISAPIPPELAQRGPRLADFGWQNPAWGGADEGAPYKALDFALANAFFYGLDDVDLFSRAQDWHPPGLAEHRLFTLFLPMVDQLLRCRSDEGAADACAGSPGLLPPDFLATVPSAVFNTSRIPYRQQREEPHAYLIDDLDSFSVPRFRGPAFISLHSGMWDAAFFGRMDLNAGKTSIVPLTSERLQWWQRRMRSVIRTVKRVYPHTPIWFRTVHRVGNLTLNPWGGFVNLFTDMCAHSLPLPL